MGGRGGHWANSSSFSTHRNSSHITPFHGKFLSSLCIFATDLVIVVASRVVFAIYLLPEIGFFLILKRLCPSSI